MNSRFLRAILILLCVICFVGGRDARADDTALPAHRELRIGTVVSEPWVMYESDASGPEGFSIDLWNEIARRLNVTTKWVRYQSMPDLLDAVKKNEVDAAISAVTITLERETFLDFSNSMYETGLRILTRSQRGSTGSTVRALLKTVFWNVNTVFVLAVLVVVAHLLWFFNRRREGDFVPVGYRDGIIESLRWAFQGLIGSGGGIPKKGGPWLIGIIWNFSSKMLFVVLTGVFSAALALAAIEAPINSLADLAGKRTAVVKGEAPERAMDGVDTTLVPVKSFQEGLDFLIKGNVDALVHDAPKLQYWRGKTNQRENKDVLRVTMEDFHKQNYGIIMPFGSKLRKEVNMQLLNIREPKIAGGRSFYDELVAKWIPR